MYTSLILPNRSSSASCRQAPEPDDDGREQGSFAGKAALQATNLGCMLVESGDGLERQVFLGAGHELVVEGNGLVANLSTHQS